MEANLSRRLSFEDAGFLYFEKPQAPLHVGSLGIYEGTIPFKTLVEHLESRMHTIPRYRQRVHFVPFNLGHPTWEDDASFDIRRPGRGAAGGPPGPDPRAPAGGPPQRAMGAPANPQSRRHDVGRRLGLALSASGGREGPTAHAPGPPGGTAPPPHHGAVVPEGGPLLLEPGPAHFLQRAGQPPP